VTAAGRQDMAEIARLMEVAFGSDLPAQFLRPDFLEWKFFVSRPDWDGPRSYVARDGDRIRAHACVWPTAFECPAGEVQASHLIDWLADPSAPGAGITVYQHLMRLTGAVLAIGGGAQAAPKNRLHSVRNPRHLCPRDPAVESVRLQAPRRSLARGGAAGA